MLWQPIETAPKDGTLVDLWVSGPRNLGARTPDCWFSNGRWLHDYGDRGDGGPEHMLGDAVTHWMRRPSAPPLQG